MAPHTLANFQIQKYQNQPKLNAVYSRDNVTRIKNGTYVINFDEYKLMKTHWVELYVNGDNVPYLDGFQDEHIQKEIKRFIGNKNITTNSYRIQEYDSVILC